MKHSSKFLYLVIFATMLFSVVTFGCICADAAVTGYSTDRLIAMYDKDEQTLGSNIWKDSINGYNISLSGKNSTISSSGLNLHDDMLAIPTQILNTLKSNEFTIEIYIKDFKSLSNTYNAILTTNQTSNRDFLLYRDVSSDKLIFKRTTTDGVVESKRPTFSTISDKLSSDCLITITFRYGITLQNNKYVDICCLYINGQAVSTSKYVDSGVGKDGYVTGTLRIPNLYLGHNGSANKWSGIVSAMRVYSRALADSEVLAHYNLDVSRKYGLDNTPVRLCFDTNISDNRVIQLHTSTNQLCTNITYNITVKGDVPNNSTLALTTVMPKNTDFSTGIGTRYTGKMSHTISVAASTNTIQTFDLKKATIDTNVKLNAGSYYYIILYDNVTKKMLSWAKVMVAQSDRSFNQISLSTTVTGLNRNFVPFDTTTNRFTSDVKITLNHTGGTNAYLFVTDKRPSMAYYQALPSDDASNPYSDQMYLLYDKEGTDRKVVYLNTSGTYTYTFNQLQPTNTYNEGTLGTISAGKMYYLCVVANKNGVEYLSCCISFFACKKQNTYAAIGMVFDNPLGKTNVVRKTVNTIKDSETIHLTNTGKLMGAKVYFVITDIKPTDGTLTDFYACRSYLTMGYVTCSDGYSSYTGIKINEMTTAMSESYQGSTICAGKLETGNKYYLCLVLDQPSRSDLNPCGFVVTYKQFEVVDSESRKTTSALESIQLVVGNDLIVRVKGGTRIDYYNDATLVNSEFSYADISQYTVKFTINDKVTEVKAGSTNEFVLEGLKFTDMETVVKIDLYKGTTLVDSKTGWTVKQYLTADGSQKALELLRLGSALLKYNQEPGYDVAGILDPYDPSKPAVTKKPTRTTTKDYFTAGSLYLDDNVNLVFKYTYTNATKLVITGEGQTVTYEGDALKSKRSISTDVYVTGFAKEYVATLYDSNGNVLSKVKYSVLTYIYDMYDGADQYLKPVLDALLGLYKAVTGISG